jgi:hypothetical protein
MRLDCGAAPFIQLFEIGTSPKSALSSKHTTPQAGRDFATGRPAKCPCGLLNFSPRESGARRGAVSWVEGIMLAASLRKGAAALALAALALGTPAAAATATPPAAAAHLSTDVILRWINDYRQKPDPERLPALVRSLSALQAFKDPETCGAYVGFIAGVLGSNPTRAKRLLGDMLSIASADRWVLVRAIAYSGLPNWKDVLVAVGEQMPERHPMINRYLEGKLPTLDQIAYPTGKPGMLDKIQVALHFKGNGNKAVALPPTPQLIDVLWGYYLATGAYKPVGQIIKLLPLAEDKDNVDSLTTGSAAKFTLASNAVRDLKLLAILKSSVKSAPKDTAKVLNDVIETAEDVDTGRMRRESLAAIEELKEKGPNSKREFTSMGSIGQGALSMGCIVAAATGQIELGLPCVIGGAAYSAGLQYMAH